MAAAYLLKGGTIATWTKEGAKTYKADILVEESTITGIDENIPVTSNVVVIDCKNKWIAPGFVDTHR